MFTPFHDSKGNPLELYRVNYKHLETLRNTDEGYSVEYKVNLDDSVKRKIPAIISSFANSAGGWLVIGIKDKTFEIVPMQKSRSDYSQTIGQIIKGRISPLPVFECKFIHIPNNSSKGVLLVYIPEGRFSPYIADGTVYIRNGSSSEPIKSDRATIDILYKKANQYKKEILQFSNRTMFIPHFWDPVSGNEIKYRQPIINLNFKYIGRPNDRLKQFSVIQDIVDMFSNDKEIQLVKYTDCSIVFLNSDVIPYNGIAHMFELFFDGSVKFLIPLKVYSQEDRKSLAASFQKLHAAFLHEDSVIIDGYIAIHQFYHSLECLDSIAKKIKVNSSEYAFICGYENIGGVIPYFDGDIFMEYIHKEGLCYCISSRSRGDVYYLKRVVENNSDFWRWVLIDEFIFPLFGFNYKIGHSIYFEANSIYLSKTTTIQEQTVDSVK